MLSLILEAIRTEKLSVISRPRPAVRIESPEDYYVEPNALIRWATKYAVPVPDELRPRGPGRPITPMADARHARMSRNRKDGVNTWADVLIEMRSELLTIWQGEGQPVQKTVNQMGMADGRVGPHKPALCWQVLWCFAQQGGRLTVGRQRAVKNGASFETDEYRFMPDGDSVEVGDKGWGRPSARAHRPRLVIDSERVRQLNRALESFFLREYGQTPSQPIKLRQGWFRTQFKLKLPGSECHTDDDE